MVAQRAPYDLLAFFHAPLHDVDAVRYRQAACRDLEDDRVRKAVDGFAEGMVVMRRRRSHALQLRHRNHRFRWFREAVRVYCDTVLALRDELAGADLGSEAFTALRGYLADYTAAADFTAMADDGTALDEELASVRYTVQINSGRVTVRRYDGGDDYRHNVEATFSKFERGEVKDRRVEYSPFSDLNHVEAQVLELVAELFPGPFGRLAEYCTTHRDFIAPRIARFDREVQFYLAWLGSESVGFIPRWAVLLWAVMPGWMAVSLGGFTEDVWVEVRGWSPGVVMRALATFALMLLSIGCSPTGCFIPELKRGLAMYTRCWCHSSDRGYESRPPVLSRVTVKWSGSPS